MRADELEILGQMRRDGRPYREIADRLGRTTEYLQQQASDHHLTNLGPIGFWSQTKIDGLRKLAAERLTSGEIGRELGCSRNAVIGKAGRLHVELYRGNGHGHLTKGKTRPRSRQPRQTLLQPAFNTVEMTELPVEPTPTTGVFFRDMEESNCRWPVAGEPGPMMRCCGADRMQAGEAYVSSYCTYHEARSRVRHVSRGHRPPEFGKITPWRGRP